jgi:hypothetical protein
VRFDVEVENNIKGGLSYGAASFFFFVKVDQNPDYMLFPGLRYIVSLRPEGDVLRSWADGTQLKIEVRSGSHKQEDLPIGAGPGRTIAYILLTPGIGANLAEFGVERPRYGDSLYVYDLFKQLQLRPERSLRDSACLAIAAEFWMRPKCLEELAGSPDDRIRKSAVEFLHDDVRLPERLEINPFFMTRPDWTEDALQTLDVFADDMRPEVHKEACALLHRLAPTRHAENCR